MSLLGQKHLVQCRCVLPQFQKQKDPQEHKFVVFSIIDTETNKTKVTYAVCNNCGIIHKITDICTSEIINKDDVGSLQTIDDIKICLPEKLLKILDKYEIDLPTWQQIEFVLNNEQWMFPILLVSDTIDNVVQCKCLIFYSKDLFKIEQITKDIVL